jgi:aminoglycoside phosphotransferase (APT) family kinase protein
VHEWAPEVRVDEPLARRLIGEQFPEVEGRSFELLGEGWDTTVYLVDDRWTFRFPRKAMVIPGFRNEIAHLPALAPLLPLPIPVPTLVGEPSEEFDWPFYGAPFLPGTELAEADLDDGARAGLALPLAEFLRTLHAVELDADLPLDPVRRADMPFRVERTRDRMDTLTREGLWRAPPLVEELLVEAEGMPPPEPASVCHGDLHLRHLLVGRDGQPAAVIDWIDLSRNDPAVDLTLLWSSLPPDTRGVFLDAYGEVTDEQLLRARVLALFLCGTLALFGHHEGQPMLEREALAGLERTCTPAIIRGG